MTDAVAVIIPTLNRVGLLRDAIESALACDPPPDELVVVDCGSTDNTSDVVASFGERVRLIEGSFRNAAAARNAGVATTTAPLIAFLDSDDLALPGKTGRLATALGALPDSVMVHGTIDVIDVGSRPHTEARGTHERLREHALRTGTTYPDLARFCWAFTSATLMRRDAFERAGGYDETLDAYEDWDLYLRLSLQGTIDYVDVPACRYRLWDGNVAWDRHTRGVLEACWRNLDRLPQVPGPFRRPAEFGFRSRLAGAHYTLLELRAARREALRALRLDPVAGLRSPEVRRGLVRSFVPRSVLARRRQEPTT